MHSNDLELGNADFFDFMFMEAIAMPEFSYDIVGEEQKVGVRFQDIQVPQGATITSAYLVFTSNETDSQTTTVTIYGEASDNAAPFDDWTPYDLSNRTMTNASVDWNIPAWDQMGAQHQSPDIKAIVQEIVNRPGWSAGSSMVFSLGGSGRRVATSYDGDPAAAPVLHITYTTQ